MYFIHFQYINPYLILEFALSTGTMATRGSKRKAGEEELVELPEDESLDE